MALLAPLTFLALFLSIWIVVPGPNLPLFALSVGAIEVSPLLAIGNLILLALALRSRAGWMRHLALAAAGIALLCSVVPLAEYVTASPHVPLPWMIAPMHASRVDEIALSAPDVIVYRPQSIGTYGVVIAIYGGAWERGSPRNDALLNRFLASRGYVVFAIDYRHAPAVRFPGQLNDVDSAFEWVGVHAKNYGGDPQRMVLLGHSSGAQLAFLLAARHPAAFRGVITYESPVDLRMGYLHVSQPDVIDIRGILTDLCGGPPQRRPACYRSASPLHNVHAGLPPILMIASKRDHVVVAGYEYKLRDALLGAGDRVEYVELPWADHDFEAVFNGLDDHVAMWYLLGFLERVDSPTRIRYRRPTACMPRYPVISTSTKPTALKTSAIAPLPLRAAIRRASMYAARASSAHRICTKITGGIG
ncbi:MAG: alpha/beta hydrolase [Candidatus Baltobacteraceae bacterium]